MVEPIMAEIQQVEARQTLYSAAELSAEEMAYKIHFEATNRQQINGRINSGIDGNGNLIAISISPFATQFEKNVEEGVLHLVRVLRKKRYLTYSSCEGHTTQSRRYVGIAFMDEASRSVFCDAIMAGAIPGTKVNCLDSVVNINTRINRSKLTHENVTNAERSVSSQEEAIGFNVMFKRKYHRYYFAELIILDQSPLFPWLRNPRKAWWYWVAKTYHWDDYTRKVENLIIAPDFPPYRY